MNKLHELDKIGVEPRHCISHLGTMVRCWRNNLPSYAPADAIGQRPSATLSPSVVEECIASDPEQPHACLFWVIW